MALARTPSTDHRATVGILVFGAGVIGSVYADMLLRAGHTVVLLARGRRLTELRSHGLVLEDGWSGTRTTRPVEVTGDATSGGPFDLVLVSVRAGQLEAVLPGLAAMNDGSDVRFFGNTAGRDDQLVAMLGERAMFGFPAVGGVRDGPTIRYVLISQQSTMVGEANGTSTARVHVLRGLLEKVGFPTKISTDIQAWLLAHAAFDDPDTLRTMVLTDDPRRIPRLTRRREHRDSDEPADALPSPARRFRGPLLAAGAGRSAGRTVVRRPLPRSAGRDARTGRRARSGVGRSRGTSPPSSHAC